MNTSNTIPVPLYHGTDKKIIGYSEKERAEIQELCVAISEYLYHLVSEDGLSIYSPSRYKSKRLAEIGDYWYHFIDAFQRYDSRKKGSNLYQYGSLYLTGDREKAESYARNAFIMGEQGKVAYWLYMGASCIWDLKKCKPDMNKLFDRFEKLIDKPHIPVLITFDSILKEDLLEEQGCDIDWEMGNDLIKGFSFRLKPNSITTFSDGKIEYLLNQ